MGELPYEVVAFSVAVTVLRPAVCALLVPVLAAFRYELRLTWKSIDLRPARDGSG
jgi:hypothetical protein